MEGKKFRAGKKSAARAPPHSPQSALAGNVVFRILCLESQVGMVIGKNGSVIKQLQKSTKTKIRVKEAPTDSQYRVITISVQGCSTSRVKLGVKNGNNMEQEEQEDEDEEEEVVEVSIAKEALIRVFEVLNVKSGDSIVSCRLLTKGRHWSYLVVDRSKIVEKTGCEIEIRVIDLPICADPDDALVEIHGNVLAVKKALVYISSLYRKEINSQDYRVMTRDDVNARVPHDDGLHREPLYMTSNVFQGDEIFQVDPYELSSPNPYDYVLKILCASCVFGPVVRELQTDALFSTSVGRPLADCDERLITMTSQYCPECIVRACLIANEKVREIGGGYSLTFPARLVVGTNQIGCLLAKGSNELSEMVEKRQVSLQILELEQNPKCVSDKYRVVQISGRSDCYVEGAIEQVIRRLREGAIQAEESDELKDAYYTIPEEPFPNINLWFY